MRARAKLFTNGGSQAVRLPKEFRFDGDEVLVRRVGQAVVLEPFAPSAWPAGYWEFFPVLREGEWARPTDSPPPTVESERDLP